MQSIYVDANPRLLGEIIPVEITAAHQNGLSGQIVTTETTKTITEKPIERASA
jgi:hypothetical protein